MCKSTTFIQDSILPKLNIGCSISVEQNSLAILLVISEDTLKSASISEIVHSTTIFQLVAERTLEFVSIWVEIGTHSINFIFFELTLVDMPINKIVFTSSLSQPILIFSNISFSIGMIVTAITVKLEILNIPFINVSIFIFKPDPSISL